MNLLTSWFSSPPPDAAIEICPEHVAAAVLTRRDRRYVVQAHASQPLPAGAVVASLASPNILDRRSVVEALRDVLGAIGTKPKRVALIIPDLAAKVSLVHFDQVPVRRDDLDQLVQWQVRKAAPFALEDASLTYSSVARGAGGSGDFVVEVARRDIVRDYETVCANAGVYAGLVDVASVSAINLFLGSGSVPNGDWLVVHMRSGYTSLAILRRGALIFFRTRPEGDGESLADIVHQTAMYYEDRLDGHGFARVLLGGGAAASEEGHARANLEARLGAKVEAIDPTDTVTLSDRVSVSSELKTMLTPLVGMLMRTHREAVAV